VSPLVIVKVFSAFGLAFLPSLVIGIVKYTDAVYYMLPDYAALPTLASIFLSVEKQRRLRSQKWQQIEPIGGIAIAVPIVE